VTQAEPIAQRMGLEAKAIALTFDDGPSEWTEPILDVLRSVGARATFFVIGDAIDGREEILQRVAADGHEVGNHTVSHPPLDLLTAQDVERELQFGSRRIEEVVGMVPVQFRPPGLRYNSQVLRAAGACGFRWAVLASVAMADYNMKSSEGIARRILRRVRRGSIVALHDGRPPHEPPRAAGGSLDDRSVVVGAVQQVVPDLTERGYRICTVSELLAL
jgi:peptidoglycan-N-acetylglucosamine deacetylase